MAGNVVGGPLDDRWALVEPHRGRLHAIARRRCASPADAEDCVQEAMVRVVQFADLDPARVGQLLTSVTVRLAADTHRDRVRAHRAAAAAAAWLIDDPGPEGRVCDRAEAAWVAALASELPERQRSVLAVRAAGADGVEAAARLHLSYKAVESALSRARAALRLALASTLGLLGVAHRRAPVPTLATVGVALSLVVTSVLGAVVGRRPVHESPTATVVSGRSAPAVERRTAARARPVARRPAPAPAPVGPGRPARRGLPLERDETKVREVAREARAAAVRTVVETERKGRIVTVGCPAPGGVGGDLCRAGIVLD